MIKGKSKTELEKEYRAIPRDSSSSLKMFAEDRRKYYKRYFLGEKVEEKDNLATNMGKIVETLLFEPEEFDNRFYMSLLQTAPTGLMLEFVEALYSKTVAATDVDGKLTKAFGTIAKEAYEDSSFKISFEAVMKKFEGSDAEIYYNEIRKVRGNNLTVIGSKEVGNAEKIIHELKNDYFISGIINLETNDRYEVFNQFSIENYIVDEHNFKSLLDKIIIDHSSKNIEIYDLKCTWSVENFLGEYYLHRKAYIQGYLYYKAVKSLTENKQSKYYGYSVSYPKFIVCDSINYYSPLIYKMTEQDIINSYEGFNCRNREYKGVKELIKDLKFAQENNIWNISRKNYINNGEVNLI